MVEFSGVDLKWLWSITILPITWFSRLVWTNHKSIHELRVEIAQSPTHVDLKKCRDETRQHIDDVIQPIKDGHTRIEAKIDKLIDRELNKK